MERRLSHRAGNRRRLRRARLSIRGRDRSLVRTQDRRWNVDGRCGPTTRAIEQANARSESRFRLLQGIEANIDAAGRLDLTHEEAATFDIVLAAPHSILRKNEDQTDRMLAAVAHPNVRILAHPRGRISGSRAGVVANWDSVFAAAAQRGVAIELDGDPARQDLDHTLARHALVQGCIFALDSDAHTTTQLSYAETALAHARLAGIPAGRIVNCWPLDQLLAWLSDPSSAWHR
jgi:histidinol phosphatase-like PHP family hydrolase